MLDMNLTIAEYFVSRDPPPRDDLLRRLPAGGVLVLDGSGEPGARTV